MKSGLRQQKLPISFRTSIQCQWARHMSLSWMLGKGVSVDRDFDNGRWRVSGEMRFGSVVELDGRQHSIIQW